MEKYYMNSQEVKKPKQLIHKGNDFLDYEGLTKYHDRLVESVDERIATVKKQLERKDQELLDYEIRPISGAVGVIQKEIDDLEITHTEEAETIAATLNYLDTKLSKGINGLIPLIEQNTSDINALESKVDDNELTTQNAINDLSTLVNQNSEGITSLESVIVENELTTSAALHELNDRLLDTIDTATIDAMFL